MIVYPNLIMLIGIPGSGKSTIAKKYAEIYDAEIMSSDEYRKVLVGDENDQSNNKKVFDCLYNDIAINFGNGKNCILDATNISVKVRQKCFNAIDNALKRNNVVLEFGYRKIAVICLTPIIECILRDKRRERSVGEKVICKFVSQFEYPQFFEGFDIIDDEPNGRLNSISRIDFYRAMSGFNQNSKYHKYDLLTHSLVLADYFLYDRIRYEAAIFHDIGKIMTEKKDEEGFSHYYQHANYSAYIIACNMKAIIYDIDITNGYSVNDIIFYINQHMHIRDIIKSPKAIEKYKKLYGEERFNKLVEFMNYDNLASGRNNSE